MAGRIYVSCAEVDAKEWRDPILVAWKPYETSGLFNLWHRQAQEDWGQPVEYHAAIVLATQTYLADEHLMKAECGRFVGFEKLGRKLFWIPIDDALYDQTILNGIMPAWGFRQNESPVAISSQREKSYKSIVIEVGRAVESWWKTTGLKLPEKLEDTQIGNRVVTEPKPQAISVGQIKANDPARLRLPCLIDREPQEKPVRRRLAADAGKIVFVLPGPPEERPDRFADRLDGFTLAEIRTRAGERPNFQFCRTSWPNYVEGGDARGFFEEYLDSVFMAVLKGTRLDSVCDMTKGDADLMIQAAGLLKKGMAETRFLFWTEATAGKPGKTAKELFRLVFAWWRYFVPSAADTRFLPPVAVLALTTAKSGLSSYLPDEAPGDHLEEVSELAPIEYQDMVNWINLQQIRDADPAENFRSKVNALFPNRNERISFEVIEGNVTRWLSAS